MKGKLMGFILLLIASCNTDNDPVRNDFEIEVDTQYYVKDQTDAWIFFHDSEGKLIDQSQITNGQSLKFRTLSVSDKQVSVTLVRVLMNISGDPSFNLESFLNVNFPTPLPVFFTGKFCNQ